MIQQATLLSKLVECLKVDLIKSKDTYFNTQKTDRIEEEAEEGIVVIPQIAVMRQQEVAANRNPDIVQKVLRTEIKLHPMIQQG